MKTLIAYRLPSRRSPNAAWPHQGQYPFTHGELSDDEDRPERGRPSKNNVSSENWISCITASSMLPWKQLQYSVTRIPLKVSLWQYSVSERRNALDRRWERG
ncbi:MAG TPA: hypothetical protein VFS35_05260, partial [Terrimicrobiaceae bacterium]|nr:hypothetical protein [Terrimicrobiaceae bacterium]